MSERTTAPTAPPTVARALTGSRLLLLHAPWTNELFSSCRPFRPASDLTPFLCLCTRPRPLPLRQATIFTMEATGLRWCTAFLGSRTSPDRLPPQSLLKGPSWTRCTRGWTDCCAVRGGGWGLGYRRVGEGGGALGPGHVWDAHKVGAGHCVAAGPPLVPPPPPHGTVDGGRGFMRSCSRPVVGHSFGSERGGSWLCRWPIRVRALRVSRASAPQEHRLLTAVCQTRPPDFAGNCVRGLSPRRRVFQQKNFLLEIFFIRKASVSHKTCLTTTRTIR